MATRKGIKKNKIAEFVHLRAHSACSLSRGAIQVDDVVRMALAHNMPALAITDTGNLFGSLEFSLACASRGVQPIIGCVVSIAEDGGDVTPGQKKPDPAPIVLLAKDGAGYQNILKLVSKSYLECEDSHNPTLTLKDFKGYSDGLIALTGGADGVVGQYLLSNRKDKAIEVLQVLQSLFAGRLYIELTRHGRVEEQSTENIFIDLAQEHNIPLVATNDVHFASPDMFEAHNVLNCIADGAYISEDPRHNFTKEHYFKSPREMTRLFADIPEAIENTMIIAKRCAVMSEARAPMLPGFPTEGGRSEDEELRAVAEEGLRNHLKEHVFTPEMDEKQKEETAKPYWARLEYELGVIIDMKFPGYFLIVSDFMRWSKSQDIPVGPGRGSGAGSVIAWVLQITDLDPLRFGLLFERFLNPERVSMPDFDIDFCQERRDEVITYVRDKYGADKVAQIITFGKLQARAALRDVGRVLQLPYGKVDAICKMIPFNPLEPVTLSQAIKMDGDLRRERDTDESVARMLNIALKLEGLYRHASTHAAGVVIADRPLDELVPLYRDSRSDMPVTQYSMKYAEKAGLVKFDFLGLKTLTVIDRACKLIRENGVEIDIRAIPFDDEATFAMLSEGRSVGVFQMESAGMRDSLRKMKPDTIEDIIALISLYRPGPMENIPTYIACKHGKQEPDYMHPKLEPILKETFGVMIYQEQVMQIAQVLAGYSLGGADLLRRAMGKKIKAEMDAQREKFIEGAVAANVDKKQANQIFDKVAKFAGYGFNKSHAAAYAVIGYQTAYLKANYPVEFLAACINIDVGDTDKIDIFREEIMREGICLLPPDVNNSHGYFTVEKLLEGQAGENKHKKRGIRYGLGGLKNVGLAAMEEIAAERKDSGKFKTIFDFITRVDAKLINKRQLENMSKAGAFDNIHPNRRQVFENTSLLTRYSHEIQEEKNSGQDNLFGGLSEDSTPLPALKNVDDWQNNERMMQEFDALGFYLTDHPMNEYLEELAGTNIFTGGDIEDTVAFDSARITIAGLITQVRYRSSGNRRFAHAKLSQPAGSMEISIFSESIITEHRELLGGNKPLLVQVEARKDEGGVRLLAESVKSLDEYLDGKSAIIDIELSDIKDIAEMNNLLGIQGGGRKKVMLSLLVADKNREVEVTLGHSFVIRKNTLQKIANLPCVKKVTEL